MHNKKRTKIIATIGPASETPEKVRGLIEAGVNVFRFNMKHADPEWHSEKIEMVQEQAEKLDIPVGILVDLQGFEIRIATREEAEFEMSKGDNIVFGTSFEEGVDVMIPEIAFNALEEDDSFLIDDGFVEFVVREKKGNTFRAEVQNGGVVKNQKSLNLPGKNLDVSSLVEEDLRKLDLLAKSEVDFVALSFARKKEDVLALREELRKRDIDAWVVSKVENRQSLSNIDELIEHSDAIMIARGDLGVEIPIGELAFWQREIINKCRRKRRSVIVATQMLYSMIQNPRPTRAEATDVANAVFHGTDAVMLSEETAMGDYAVEVAEAMADILRFNEKFHVFERVKPDAKVVTDNIVEAAFHLIEREGSLIDMAVVFTDSGYTAKTLSSFRPQIPVVAITGDEKTAELLTLSYGVTPLVVSRRSATVDFVLNTLKKNKVPLPSGNLALIKGQHKKKRTTQNSLSVISFN